MVVIQNIISDEITMSCDNKTQIVTGAGRIINSPNYPMKYGGGLDCKILLISEVKTKIAIRFTQFSVFPGYFFGCYDWIDIYDGSHLSSEIIRSSLCGDSNEEYAVAATENSMLIRFQSYIATPGGFFKFKMGTGKYRLCFMPYIKPKCNTSNMIPKTCEITLLFFRSY